MFYGEAFREEAVARLSRPEPLDHRLQVTAPREWMVLAGVGLSLFALRLLRRGGRPVPTHLLWLGLRDPPRLPLADGAGARARIVLERRSLAALLLAGGSV